MAIEKHYIRDEVKNFLDGLAALNGPALTDMTLEEARLSYRALHEMADADAQGLAVIKNQSNVYQTMTIYLFTKHSNLIFIFQSQFLNWIFKDKERTSEI